MTFDEEEPIYRSHEHGRVAPAEGGVQVPELCREWHQHRKLLQVSTKYGDKCGPMMMQMKALADENRRLKRMFADLSIEADLLKEALGKNDPAISVPGAGRETVAQRGVSVALACRTFCASWTCYRYSPKRNADNVEIADMLLGLVKAKKI